jgi:hypothetical protein
MAGDNVANVRFNVAKTLQQIGPVLEQGYETYYQRRKIHALKPRKYVYKYAPKNLKIFS